MTHPELYYYRPADAAPRTVERQADVCVYGATTAGIAAAITARRQGLSVVLLEPGKHVGGMTAGGLSMTDIGNKRAIGGLSRSFYRRCGAHYGVQEEWRFEPHVAEQVFLDMLAEAGVEGRHEEGANDWAERGRKATDNRQQGDLNRYVDREYTRRIDEQDILSIEKSSCRGQRS